MTKTIVIELNEEQQKSLIGHTGDFTMEDFERALEALLYLIYNTILIQEGKTDKTVVH